MCVFGPIPGRESEARMKIRPMKRARATETAGKSELPSSKPELLSSATAGQKREITFTGAQSGVIKILTLARVDIKDSPPLAIQFANYISISR